MLGSVFQRFAKQSPVTVMAAALEHGNLREHGNLPWEAAGEEQPVGRVSSGLLYEQPVCLTGEDCTLELRRVRLELKEPTRNGETEIAILTNLSAAEASPQLVASRYKKRWKIEHAFQELTEHLEAEVNTLGYPRAALFGLLVGFVDYTQG